MDVVEIQVANEDETRQFAERLAGFLRPGDALCLTGDLGAGKTTFTRYLTAALGSPSPVSSPTFTLIHEYDGGRLPIYHADAYRLRGPEDAEGTGLEEYLMRGDGVLVVEWPERIAGILPPERLEIGLIEANDGEPGEARRVTLTPHGSRWSNFAAEWTTQEGSGC